MSIARKYLLPIAVIGAGTFIATPSASAWMRGERVRPYSPGPGQEHRVSMWVNRSRTDATLTLLDRITPQGHVLVMDPANGSLIRDLKQGLDAFTLPPLKQVGLLFVPNGATLGMGLRIAVGRDQVEFSLRKQYVSSILGGPLFNNRPGAFPPSTSRINVYRSGFEDPRLVPFIECLD